MCMCMGVCFYMRESDRVIERKREGEEKLIKFISTFLIGKWKTIYWYGKTDTTIINQFCGSFFVYKHTHTHARAKLLGANCLQTRHMCPKWFYFTHMHLIYSVYILCMHKNMSTLLNQFFGLNQIYLCEYQIS